MLNAPTITRTGQPNETSVPLSSLRSRAGNLLRPALRGEARRKERRAPNRERGPTIAVIDPREFPNRRQYTNRSLSTARRWSAFEADCYSHECPDRYVNHNVLAPALHRTWPGADREIHRDRSRTIGRLLHARTRRGAGKASRLASASTIGAARPDSSPLWEGPLRRLAIFPHPMQNESWRSRPRPVLQEKTRQVVLFPPGRVMH
jgi:hypothetical protein